MCSQFKDETEVRVEGKYLCKHEKKKTLLARTHWNLFICRKRMIDKTYKTNENGCRQRGDQDWCSMVRLEGWPLNSPKHWAFVRKVECEWSKISLSDPFNFINIHHKRFGEEVVLFFFFLSFLNYKYCLYFCGDS